MMPRKNAVLTGMFLWFIDTTAAPPPLHYSIIIDSFHGAISYTYVDANDSVLLYSLYNTDPKSMSTPNEIEILLQYE